MTSSLEMSCSSCATRMEVLSASFPAMAMLRRFKFASMSSASAPAASIWSSLMPASSAGRSARASATAAEFEVMLPHGLRCGIRSRNATSSSLDCTLAATGLKAGMERLSATSALRGICTLGELSTASAGGGASAFASMPSPATCTAALARAGRRTPSMEPRLPSSARGGGAAGQADRPRHSPGRESARLRRKGEGARGACAAGAATVGSVFI
mmetsp:Transcript_29120/g.73118  ORF Transcript_29120/g.73118 Transcript_29120/m.73118 type:complete len:213 (+) Transcript_29120:986-1624(+)